MSEHVKRLVTAWRERARFRRGDITAIDTEGRLLLVSTAHIYEACATELEHSLELENEAAAMQRRLMRIHR